MVETFFFFFILKDMCMLNVPCVYMLINEYVEVVGVLSVSWTVDPWPKTSLESGKIFTSYVEAISSVRQANGCYKEESLFGLAQNIIIKKRH